MPQEKVWSIGGAAATAQVQPKLVETQVVQAKKTDGVLHESTPPDASLFLIPVCLVVVWAIAALPFFRELSKTKSGGGQFLRISKIPCRNCQFFSKNSYLKCAVHPTTAMTEDAANCSDYCSNQNTTSHT